MLSLVFRVLTFAGSAALFGYLTRHILRRRAEHEQHAKEKQLPGVVDKGEAGNDTVDVEIISGDED